MTNWRTDTNTRPATPRPPGSQYKFDIKRDGKLLQITVTIGDFGASGWNTGKFASDLDRGMEVRELHYDLLRRPVHNRCH